MDGPGVLRFEQTCPERFGGGHGVAVANGSVALEPAVRALGIGMGDEVIVSPHSFVASAFCVKPVRATPLFADVDRDSGNIATETIEGAFSDRTRPVIPVQFAGWSAAMPAIMDFAKGHGLKIIEDCAQAHRARIDGQSVGRFGDAAAFCQDKIFSTGGEGGFVSFRDRDASNGHGHSRTMARTAAKRSYWLRSPASSAGSTTRSGPTGASPVPTRRSASGSWRNSRSGLREGPSMHAFGQRRSMVFAACELPRAPAGVQHPFYKRYFHIDAPPAKAGAPRFANPARRGGRVAAPIIRLLLRNLSEACLCRRTSARMPGRPGAWRDEPDGGGSPDLAAGFAGTQGRTDGANHSESRLLDGYGSQGP